MNSSRLLDKAVDQFASLPGVGRKTALKFVLHLLKKDVQEVDDFLKSIGDLKKNIKECRRCHKFPTVKSARSVQTRNEITRRSAS